MKIDFKIREIYSNKDLNLLHNFLLYFPISYPNYNKWVNETCIPEINSGRKNAILAFHEDRLIGDIITQKHEELSNVLEIKNLRIDPRYNGRGLGYFLLKQIEAENKDFGMIYGDIRQELQGTIRFFELIRFKKIMTVSLYNNKLDTIVMKELGKNKKLEDFI